MTPQNHAAHTKCPSGNKFTIHARTPFSVAWKQISGYPDGGDMEPYAFYSALGQQWKVNDSVNVVYCPCMNNSAAIDLRNL